ncbi:MAG: Fe-S cluster assembly ATPase SufC [Chloroflexi bacterium HGW-Chloroflexi-1]|nr:MAG: Fe-S cluster assembly ATPase SufC [Chloroflexi bacterium HGW-Chloroflexi-1]
MPAELVIKDLHVDVEGKPILRGVNLTIRQGEVHALMGPNGSGKSTLAYTIAGHPHYQVTDGDILLDGRSILGIEPHERARAGLFLAFQYPTTIPGVSMANFLRQAVSAVRGYTDKAKQAVAEGDSARPIGSELMPMREFRNELSDKMEALHIDAAFARRYLNDGFSGGEKKRAEILQMAMLEPKIAILDETDSGLDIDALRVVAEGINSLVGPQMGTLLITHYQRLLNYIKPDFVHVFFDGRVVLSGGPELTLELEAKGYDWIRQEFGEPV